MISHPANARRVAGVTGLEPAASGVTGQRSNRLSYTPSGLRGWCLGQLTGSVKRQPPTISNYLPRRKFREEKPENPSRSFRRRLREMVGDDRLELPTLSVYTRCSTN